MNKEIILNKLNCLIRKYTENVVPDTDIMSEPAYLPPYNMVALFLDIEKEFSIDLNELLPKLSVFSLNAIVENIFVLHKKE